jgi:hypothetical protein
MKHRLTKEPDDRDFGAIDAMPLEQALSGLRVRLGHHAFGLGQDPGARPAVEQRGGIGERLAQQVALLRRIGAINGWAGVAERDAVGREQSRIDPVQGGSTHESDGFERDHGCTR